MKLVNFFVLVLLFTNIGMLPKAVYAGDLDSNEKSTRYDGTRLAIVPKVTIESIEHISSSAREMADLSGISALLIKLEQLQKNQVSGDLSLEGVTKRQRLIYLRNKLNALVQGVNIQINCVRGRLDAATAEAEELTAYITERRNRVTHKNSQINLISGGITKIIGYSIALSPLTDIPTNVLEVFDGTVQTGLSTFALRQEKQEARMEHGLPSILDAFLTGNGIDPHFPKSVWRFMNDADPQSSQTKSRRLKLIEGWEKSGILSNVKQAKESARLKHNVTIELLDQRLAMLSDVKSVVSEMHSGLMELSDAIVTSYEVDPEW